MEEYNKLHHLLAILRSRDIGFDELKEMANSGSSEARELINKTRVDRIRKLTEEEIQQLAKEIEEVKKRNG